MIGSCIAFNPCCKCDEKANCNICELTYYRNGYIKSPAADVVEVRHGEWGVDAYKGDEIVRIPYVVHQHDEPYCSLCGTYALLDGKGDYMPSNYCPECGAKMDGERKER